MPAVSTSGTKFHIGTSKATPAGTATEFATDTYKEIKGLTEIGELGGTYDVGTVERIDIGLEEKFKGIRRLGTVELTCEYIAADPGQVAMEAAYASPNAFNFKIVLSDGKVFYAKAFVTSTRIVTGGVNDAVMYAYTLERTDHDNVPAA